VNDFDKLAIRNSDVGCTVSAVDVL
jgi:hypothetical protein